MATGMHCLELLERVAFLRYMLGGELYYAGIFHIQSSRLDNVLNGEFGYWISNLPFLFLKILACPLSNKS